MKTSIASTALALILGLGLGVASQPAGADEQTTAMSAESCDTDNSGFISAKEASLCADEEFGELTATDEDYLTEEQFGTMYQGTGEPGTVFAEMDEDGDGQISHDEWVNWRERGFAEAAEGSEEMATGDFSRWQNRDITAPERPQLRSPTDGGTGGTGSGGSSSGGGSGSSS